MKRKNSIKIIDDCTTKVNGTIYKINDKLFAKVLPIEEIKNNLKKLDIKFDLEISQIGTYILPRDTYNYFLDEMNYNINKIGYFLFDGTNQYMIPQFILPTDNYNYIYEPWMLDFMSNQKVGKILFGNVE